ncbi:MAG: PorP/SprF family type IX secretion system membrane protein [Bacteroidetes bacterium]|nr:PorP/SprF family type IX secretion system membrane protein [Bacteroidota bacterium]
MSAASVNAQQSASYSQFVLNDYGLNPAVAGSGKGWMFMVGRRTQWRGFSDAPESTFATVSKDFGKKGYRRYWHGVGASVEQDKFGIFSSKSAYASYAVHLKLSAKLYMSFGLAAGVKNVAITNSVFDANDPILNNRNPSVIIPDIIPGVYLYSKKVFAGVAVRNLYKNTLAMGGRQIGSGSRLIPTAYVTLGKKIVSPGYDFIIVPAVHLQSSFSSLPVTHLNCMVYYRKRIGLGVTYKVHDAVSAMLQVRVFKNVVVGFAYDYTVSKFRNANANSTEFMFGFSPVMSSENYDRPAGAADCPKFEL